MVETVRMSSRLHLFGQAPETGWLPIAPTTKRLVIPLFIPVEPRDDTSVIIVHIDEPDKAGDRAAYFRSSDSADVTRMMVIGYLAPGETPTQLDRLIIDYLGARHGLRCASPYHDNEEVLTPASTAEHVNPTSLWSLFNTYSLITTGACWACQDALGLSAMDPKDMLWQYHADSSQFNRRD